MTRRRRVEPATAAVPRRCCCLPWRRLGSGRGRTRGRGARARRRPRIERRPRPPSAVERARTPAETAMERTCGVRAGDGQAQVARGGLAGEQPEVDATGADARPRRHDEDDLVVGGRPEPRHGVGDLVIEVEVPEAMAAVCPTPVHACVTGSSLTSLRRASRAGHGGALRRAAPRACDTSMAWKASAMGVTSCWSTSRPVVSVIASAPGRAAMICRPAAAGRRAARCANSGSSQRTAGAPAGREPPPQSSMRAGQQARACRTPPAPARRRPARPRRPPPRWRPTCSARRPPRPRRSRP